MKHPVLVHSFVAAVAAGVAISALAASVHVENCWIRAMPPSVPSSAYFTLRNDGDAPVSLTAVSTSTFGMAMLHETITEGGTSKMVHIDSAPVSAHGQLTFAPKGYHVMLENPAQTLTIGTQIPMTFSFADRLTVSASCDVRPASFVGQ
jgi:hypothetical protein